MIIEEKPIYSSNYLLSYMILVWPSIYLPMSLWEANSHKTNSCNNVLDFKKKFKKGSGLWGPKFSLPLETEGY